ncbi:nucleotidyltransferase [Gorillibacterium sp. sgz5001074]|uniref:nucleotidyltransferase n=1 Tax=Gorillibacterium sp. sgz5001074 TaxID=3446695 RepID=UPI003F66B940
MRTVGLIVEYNPLHNGHAYHFEQSKLEAKADACVAVMSGHFLQRGEPAVVGKWARAEMALRMGADLVLELPVAYSSQPAEWFAYGAVRLLDATGVVDALCFGSEDGRIGPIASQAERLYREPEGFRDRLMRELKRGVSYPAAYAAAAEADGKEQASGAGAHPDVAEEEDGLRLDQPNNILGLHYLLALRRINSSIVPLTITRTKAGYHDTGLRDASIASATAIRKLIIGEENTSFDGVTDPLQGIEPYVPGFTVDILRREFAAGRGPIGWERFAGPLFAQLLGRSPGELSTLCEVTEGLEHRIKRMLREFPTGSASPVEDLLERLKTKRYTRAKLQRTLLRILLQHPKHELTRQKLSEGPGYLRVLGFNDTGRALLKRMKQKAALPVVTRVGQDVPPFLDMDIRATSVYSLAYRSQTPDEWLRDYYQAPLQV